MTSRPIYPDSSKAKHPNAQNKQVSVTAVLHTGGHIEPNSAADPFAPRGTTIGTFRDMPIYDTLTQGGLQYEFDRIAVFTGNKMAAAVGQLESQEMMVPPGLIYRPRGG